MTKNQVVIGCKNDINHNPADKYWETIMEGWGAGGWGWGCCNIGSPGTKLLNKMNHTEHNSSISFIPHSHSVQAYQFINVHVKQP